MTNMPDRVMTYLTAVVAANVFFLLCVGLFYIIKILCPYGDVIRRSLEVN